MGGHPFPPSLGRGSRRTPAARPTREANPKANEDQTMTTATTTQADVYTRVTAALLAALDAGTRPWMQPWNAAHAAGPVSRPLRHNSQPYSGVNVLMLWMEATAKGYSTPIWMTYHQAKE